MARAKVAPVVFKESKRFKPHYNNALGHYCHTKEDYLSSMKAKGLEPYTGEAPKPKMERPDTKPTNDVLKAIQACSNKDGSFTPSGNLKAELMRRGVIMTKEAVNRYVNKVEEYRRG